MGLYGGQYNYIICHSPSTNHYLATSSAYFQCYVAPSSKYRSKSNKHLPENRIGWSIGLTASCEISFSLVRERRVLLLIIKSNFYKSNIRLGQSYFLNQSGFLRFFSSQSGFLMLSIRALTFLPQLIRNRNRFLIQPTNQSNRIFPANQVFAATATYLPTGKIQQQK